MRFSCVDTFWNISFAWMPVYCEDIYSYVWLEKVWKRKRNVGGAYHSEYHSTFKNN